MSLDYNNSIPLHIQLRKLIEDKILKGEYREKIPSERELMDGFYVSRSTVREAVAQLVLDGILEKRHGKGTFVSIRPIQDWLGSLSSTTETIQRMGMEPGAKLIASEILTLPEQLKTITGFSQAYYISRIRYADKIAIGIEKHFYPIEIGEQLVKYDLNKETLYDLLENELSIRTLEAEQVIKSGSVSKEDADHLRIPLNTHMLIAERRITDINGKFVEFENASYRADMYSFKIKLSRKNN
jgi:GntR family transcriptional regulator